MESHSPCPKELTILTLSQGGWPSAKLQNNLLLSDLLELCLEPPVHKSTATGLGPQQDWGSVCPSYAGPQTITLNALWQVLTVAHAYFNFGFLKERNEANVSTKHFTIYYKKPK